MRRFRDNFSFFIFRFSLLAIAAVMTGCGVSIKYSLSGASIPPDAKTFSVAYFPNNATMVSPILSSTLTEALVDMFTRRTRLMQVDEGGDFAFEGTGFLKTQIRQIFSGRDSIEMVEFSAKMSAR